MTEEYLKRLEEIKHILNTVKSLETINDNFERSDFENSLFDFFENQTNSSLGFREYINISKSSMQVMVYNLIESTVTSLIQNIYDVIADLNIEYNDISEVLKELWLEIKFKDAYQTDSSYNSYKKRAKFLISEIINQNSVDFNCKKIPGMNGNLDSNVVRTIYQKHGIVYSSDSKANKERGILSSIKKARNDLAHGNISFLENGRSISLTEFENNLSEIEIYLSDLTHAVENYISNELYRKCE
ncbi:MAE_28990/MAE_18760 family HEPN-like nuclease [Vagococcus fluvialis]|uniref:MAE_28990/MAE_18760 family HEPN-like nuclease n=1 Tax=Vagococcus fluvialis TaxID=2738 RepID=UPI001D0A88B5|nr:MAE_28990/MAE_18760 family HEPN-like nuclease [Vagococcus fluvialis]UDM73549.1 hypothetical protein K5K99_11585 [Vagococcus fluvialis]